jgi:hypothetical protein
LESDGFAKVADQLRLQLHRAAEPLTPEAKLNLRESIIWLQHARDQYVADAARMSNRAFHMDYLISCMLYTGYLKCSAQARESLEYAIRISVPDSHLCDFLIARLYEPHAIPTKSTLQRHRLTIHLGMCRWLQDLNAELFSGDVVAYRTIDASPQGGYELLITGVILIRTADLYDAYTQANKLCQWETLPAGEHE